MSNRLPLRPPRYDRMDDGSGMAKSASLVKSAVNVNGQVSAAMLLRYARALSMLSAVNGATGMNDSW